MCKHTTSSSPGRFWLAGILMLVAVVSTPQVAFAQARQDGLALSGNGKVKGKSKPTVSERPEVIGSITTSSAKPSRPGQTGGNAETALLVTRFQSARSEYLEAQKELKLTKTTELTEEQRTVLREKSREALSRWREDQRRFAEEQQERLQSIKSELQTDLAQRVDSVKEETSGGRGR